MPARKDVVDCDVHNILPSNQVLGRHLPERWRRYLDDFGLRAPNLGAFLPRFRAGGYRNDAYPPSGGPPGSDLAFVREQLLDAWDISAAILNPLAVLRFGEQFGELAAALTRAVNEWTREEWLEPEPRFYASICVAFEDPDLAVAEIERLAGNPRFLQVLLNVRTREPLGSRKYWPLYEAAAAHGLPVAVHVGGVGRHTITGAGFPSYYFEDHAGFAQAFQSHVTSLVLGGVFERFPGLKFVLQEGGFAWLPALMWRLDRSHDLLGAEVPELRRRPSEHVRERFWFTTQPIEEPERPEQFMQLVRRLGMDHAFLFATDYPHWDFDAPDSAIPASVPAELQARILAGNARELYRLPARIAA
jgi:predicted TIM-barrel fold metal-dependent hydrolase